jgi:four helix bundle protein
MEDNIKLNHEKLEVYQTSIIFIGWLSNITENINGNRNIIDQIDRASISVPLNIAECNGKSSKKEHNRNLEIAISSALECAACLDVMLAKKSLPSKKWRKENNIF